MPNRWAGEASSHLPLGDVVTLVLADYHVVFSEGLGMLLDAEDDLVVLGLAHHSRHAVDAIARYRPAVCILDAQLPDGDLAQPRLLGRGVQMWTACLMPPSPSLSRAGVVCTMRCRPPPAASRLNPPGKISCRWARG
jgi:hypothetical protein